MAKKDDTFMTKDCPYGGRSQKKNYTIITKAPYKNTSCKNADILTFVTNANNVTVTFFSDPTQFTFKSIEIVLLF